jgi:hypothetical protein
MKKILLAAISLVFASESMAQYGRYSSDHQNSIKYNVFGVFTSQYQFAYERVLNDHFSAQISLGAILQRERTFSNTFDLGTATKKEACTGFIAIPEIRYYFSGDAPSGFYGAALLRLRSVNEDMKDLTVPSDNASEDFSINLTRDSRKTAFGGGVVVGYQYVALKGFTFDIFTGLTSKNVQYNTTYADTDLNKSLTEIKDINFEANEIEEFDNYGDYLYNKKFIDFKMEEGWRPAFRFGINLGYSF